MPQFQKVLGFSAKRLTLYALGGCGLPTCGCGCLVLMIAVVATLPAVFAVGTVGGLVDLGRTVVDAIRDVGEGIFGNLFD